MPFTTLTADDTLQTRPRKRTGTPTQNSYFKREDLGSRGSIIFAKHFADILGNFREIKGSGGIDVIDDDTLLHRSIANHVSNIDLNRDADMTDLTDVTAYNIQTDDGDYLYKNTDGTISYEIAPRRNRGIRNASFSVMYHGPAFFPPARGTENVIMGRRRSNLVKGSPLGGIQQEEFIQIVTWDKDQSTFGNTEPRCRYFMMSYSSMLAGDRFRIGSQRSNAYTEFWLEDRSYQLLMVNWRSAPVISQFRFL